MPISSTAEAAKRVRENIARAKGYLRRDEMLRAMTVMSEAMRDYSKLKLVGATRFEIEVNLDETLVDISRNAAVLPLLPLGRDGKPFLLRYVRGKEELLATALGRIATTLQDSAKAAEQERIDRIESHKKELLQKGYEALAGGDLPRARSFLRRAADEFGKEPGLILQIARAYQQSQHYMEAAEMFEYAIGQFPKDSAGYSGAIDSYMEIREYEKVEKLYERVMQQFGAHARTLCSMAKFYMIWHKRDKAADFAYRALQSDSSLVEAKRILEAAEGRRG